jgi:hypothetical protein
VMMVAISKQRRQYQTLKGSSTPMTAWAPKGVAVFHYSYRTKQKSQLFSTFTHILSVPSKSRVRRYEVWCLDYNKSIKCQVFHLEREKKLFFFTHPSRDSEENKY